MTDPFTDIMSAISLGQSLSKNMQSSSRSQGSRLAWERALLDAGQWAQGGMPGQDMRMPAEPGLPPRGSLAEYGSRLTSQLPPQEGSFARSRAAAHALNQTNFRPAAQIPGMQLAQPQQPGISARLTAPVMPRAAPLSAAARAAMPYPAQAAGTQLEPRSVRLLLSQDGFQVVVRDAGMNEAAVRKLVERVQASVGQFGPRVNRIIVNGETAWEIEALAGAEFADESNDSVLEISL